MKQLQLGVAALLVASTSPWLCEPSLAQGPTIAIEKEADRRIAIGIGKYPNIPRSEIGSPAGDVLAFDLELSGWFDPKPAGLLPPKTLLDWERRGAELMIELAMSGTALVGTVRDVGTGDVLLEKTYDASLGNLRSRLHQFSDQVVFQLTGQRGLAQTQIVCEWNSGTGKRVVLMDVDGHELRDLSTDQALELTPRFSFDGQRITFTSYASGFPDVYVLDRETWSREKVAHYEGMNAHGDIGPDGAEMAFVLSYPGNPEIYSKNLSSGSIRRLTEHRATDTSPVWSPDGTRIAFVSDRTGNPQVYLMDHDGGNVERLTFRGNYNTAPDWSPDGTRIAYSSLRSDGYAIQYIEVATGRVVSVTDGGGCEDPTWSPDGRSILYSRRAGGRTDLYVSPVNERRALRVSRGIGNFTAPDWSPFPEVRR